MDKAKRRRVLRTVALMLLDAVLVNLAMILAQQMRFSGEIRALEYARYLRIAPAMTLLCLGSFWVCNLYRSSWRYASVDALLQIALATLVGMVLTYVYSLIRFAFTQPENLHLLQRTIYLMAWIVSLLLVGGSRLLLRIYETNGLSRLQGRRGQTARRVMIIGAGAGGASLIKEMQNGCYGACIPVLALDDLESRVGMRISGVTVMRGVDRVTDYAKRYAIDEIIIAIDTPDGDLQKLAEDCLATGCRVRRVNRLSDVNSRRDVLGSMRELNLSDLLGRPEENLDMTAVRACFENKRVLITGGGGSIGGELCRQMLKLGPAQITLYDISENYMHDLFFDLEEETGRKLDQLLLLRVGSVQDEARLGEVMDEVRPEVVLHAAAHKHVPLMESCPVQAVKNNVFGTATAARCAVAHGVKRFVLISTDKAVNPTNVMGATKRLAEKVIEAYNTLGQTEFTAVRFGNVLGSHGSVVPMFERQIRAGGPITLTHPDIVRYFMTIPEAASLVLQAASLAKGGELFVLDMGQPVRIMDLAERMNRLYAAQGGRPAEIVCTGLRPGEKLYEELLVADEGVSKTQSEKIYVTRPEVCSMEALADMLDRLTACLASDAAMRACLHALLPDYREPDEVNAEAEASHRLDTPGTAPADAPGQTA